MRITKQFFDAVNKHRLIAKATDNIEHLIPPMHEIRKVKE